MAEPPLQGRARHEWETRLLRADGMKPTHNHVLHALLRYAGGKPECWPSNESLALDCGVGERHVRRVLGEMAKAGIITVVVDRSVKTQRRIIINAPRGGLDTLPALNAGGACGVHAGGAYRPPETNLETGGEGRSWKAGGMKTSEASDESAVKRWALDSWNALACGADCDTVDDLVRIAGAKDSAVMGLDDETRAKRAEWIEEALRTTRPPDGLTCEGD